MAVTAAHILDRAKLQLADPNYKRWSEAELIKYINDGQREVVLYKPDASSANTNVTLVAGSKQAMPSDSIRLVSVVRNTSTNSSRAVRAVPRETLDRFKPNWHSEKQNAEVQHFVFDENDQNVFYVYPPNDGNGQVEVMYTQTPTDVASTTDNLGVSDAYANAVLDYVLYRAFSKDADIPSSAQRATGHYRALMAAISGKGQIDILVSPQAEPQAQL
jgi:hypothetical protein